MPVTAENAGIDPADTIDPTGMTVEVETTIPAAAGQVWDLLADLPRIGEFSPECRYAAWIDGSGPHTGARFEATNAAGGFEWNVVGQVIEADRPRAFAWVVFGAEERVDRPSSTWRYDLTATGDGTLVRHRFVHGPGGSGITLMIGRSPDRAAAILEERRQRLLANMRHGLDEFRAALGG